MKTPFKYFTCLISNVANSTALPPLLESVESTKKRVGLQQKAIKRLKIVELWPKVWDYCLVAGLLYGLLELVCCLVASC
jgi:hypothetical protein